MSVCASDTLLLCNNPVSWEIKNKKHFSCYFSGGCYNPGISGINAVSIQHYLSGKDTNYSCFQIIEGKYLHHNFNIYPLLCYPKERQKIS
jgi:hypothetical protein